jgi:three-Cys-motif partner protein
MWSAKLVLDNEPRWFRHFHLFDSDKNQILRLESLKAEQPARDKNNKKINRDIHIYPGDFNVNAHKLLRSGSIGQKEATFCLLDQRTFECHWTTIRALAEYKKQGENKIELFYFLPNSWQDRALAALKNEKVLQDWWGRDDWAELRAANGFKRRDIFVTRFEGELGYKYATPWPIYDRPCGSRIMYYMIHATDHDEAPKLMARAYKNAVKTRESHEQLEMEFGSLTTAS